MPVHSRKHVYERLHETIEHRDPWVGGRYLISLLWDAHGYIWHGEYKHQVVIAVFLVFVVQ